MNGLDKIVQHINEKAEKECEDILEKARKNARDKKSEGREKAEAKRSEIIQKGEREADRIKRRTLASARTKARQMKLEAQDKLIKKAFESARDELAKLRNEDKKYRKVLKDLIEDGGIAVGGGELEVSVLRGDKRLLAKKRVNKLSKRISKETGKETSLNLVANLEHTIGGAIIEKADGTVSCDNTFEARLKRMKDSLRTKIAETLFKD